MAKRKQLAQEGGERKRRVRRSPEQIVADLQKKIEEIKARAIARSLKRSPAIQLTLSVVRTIDKALAAASSEDNGALREALMNAREPLAQFLSEQGMRLPRPRQPRRRVSGTD